MNTIDTHNDNIMFEFTRDDLCDLDDMGQWKDDDADELDDCAKSLLQGSNHSLDLEKDDLGFWDMADDDEIGGINTEPSGAADNNQMLSDSAMEPVPIHPTTNNDHMYNNDTPMGGFTITDNSQNNNTMGQQNMIQPPQQPVQTVSMVQSHNNIVPSLQHLNPSNPGSTTTINNNEHGSLYAPKITTFPSATSTHATPESLIRAALASNSTNAVASALQGIGGGGGGCTMAQENHHYNEVSSPFRRENNDLWNIDRPIQRRVERRSSLPTSYTYSDSSTTNTYQQHNADIPARMTPSGSIDVAHQQPSFVTYDNGQYHQQQQQLDGISHVRAKRRGSMPSSFTYSSAPSNESHDSGDRQMPQPLPSQNHNAEQTNHYYGGGNSGGQDELVEPTGGGRMKRRSSMPSSYTYSAENNPHPQQQQSGFVQQPPVDISNDNISMQHQQQQDQQPQTQQDHKPPMPTNIDPDAMMQNLQHLMLRSEMSQKSLQHWDKKQGLPKNHSPTMVNSSRSRTQLQDGVVLTTWSGTPIAEAAQNTATRKSTKKTVATAANSAVVSSGKMSRRGTCPY